MNIKILKNINSKYSIKDKDIPVEILSKYYIKIYTIDGIFTKR